MPGFLLHLTNRAFFLLICLSTFSIIQFYLNKRGVFCQTLYSSDEIYLSEYVQGNQSGLIYSALNNGTMFVAVWECYLCDSSGYGIFARIYQANGTNLTREFQVNTYTNGNQIKPSVDSIMNQTNFVIAWSSFGQDGSDYGIFFKVFDLYGNNLTDDTRANNFTFSNQTEPKVTSLLANRTKFAIFWLSYNQYGGFAVLNMRIFSNSGQSLTNETRVTTYPTDIRYAIARVNNDASIAVAYASDKQNGYDYDIFFSTYDSYGNAGCDEVQANTILLGDQINPVLEVSADQQIFYLTWQTMYFDAQGFGIAGRMVYLNCIAPNGQLYNVYGLNDQTDPVTVALQNNNLVAIWRSETAVGELDLVARSMNSVTAFLTGEYTVNQNTSGLQSNQRAYAIDSGKYFVVVWDTRNQSGTYTGVSSRIMTYDNSKIFPEIKVNQTGGEQFSPVGMVPGSGSLHVIGWLGKEQGFARAKMRIYSFCTLIEECCHTQLCFLASSCSNFPCRAQLSGNFTASSMEILNIEALNFSANANNTYTKNKVFFSFSCVVFNNLLVYACNDPSGIFNASSANPLLTVPENYFQVAFNVTLQFKVTVSNIFSNFTKAINVTLFNKTTYIDYLCSNSSKTTCQACLQNCTTPSSCRNQTSYCPECYSDLNCNFAHPICINNTCVKNQVFANILSSSSISYIDRDLNLSSSFSTNAPYLASSFLWTCHYLNQSIWIPCYNSQVNLESNLNSSMIFIPNTNLHFLPWNQTIFSFTLNVSTQYNYSFSTINISIYKRMAIQVQPYPYYFPSQDYNVTVYQIFPNNSFNNYSLETYPLTSVSVYSNVITLLKNSMKVESFNFLALNISISSSSELISDYFWIPINHPPYDGSLEIYPLSGTALLTTYKFSAIGWIDSDLPLKYRYSFTYNLSNGFENLFSSFVFNPSYSTILPGQPTSNQSIIQLEISDSYGALTIYNTTITCQILGKDFPSSLDILIGVLSSLSDPNMTVDESTKTLNLISNRLFELEISYQNGTDPTESRLAACPVCSGRGKCQSDQCMCQIGWNFYDCSINSDLFNKIIDTKMKIFQYAENLLEDPTNKNDSKLTESMKLITSNPDFNSFLTYTKAQSILENNLKISQTNTTLTQAQAEDVSKIVDSTFKYLSLYDCNATSNLSSNTVNKSSSYMDTISRSIISNSTPDSNASIIIQDTYSLYVKKASVCNLSSFQISTESKLSPTLNISLNSTNLTNCSAIATIQYFAINSNLMSCNITAPTFFSDIALKFSDESGLKLSINPVITILFSSVTFARCDSQCTSRGLACICQNLALFDFQSQITNLFMSSQLKNILKFDALSNMNFLKSAPFWILSSYILFSIAFMLTLSRYESYDGYLKYLRNLNKSRWKRFYLNYCVIFQIYLIIIDCPILHADSIHQSKDPQVGESLPILSKIHLDFDSYFYFRSKRRYQETSKKYISHNFKSVAEKIENFSWFNPYLLVLPYLTVMPVFALFNTIINKSWKAEDSNAFFKRFISIVFTISFVAACNFFIIVITANLSPELTDQWVFNFCLLQIQDIVVYPFIDLLIYKVKQSVVRWDLVKKSKKCKISMFSDVERSLIRLNTLRDARTLEPRRIRTKSRDNLLL